jgi:hypothetical protein
MVTHQRQPLRHMQSLLVAGFVLACHDYSPRSALDMPEYRDAAKRALASCMYACNACGMRDEWCSCRDCGLLLYRDWSDDAMPYLEALEALYRCYGRNHCRPSSCRHEDRRRWDAWENAYRAVGPPPADVIPSCEQRYGSMKTK